MSSSIRDRPGLIVLLGGVGCLAVAVVVGSYLSTRDLDGPARLDRTLLFAVHGLMWVGFATGCFLTLGGLRIISRPAPEADDFLSKVDRFAQSVANRIRPRFRLGTFLVVIACLGFGLSVEADRRRRETLESESRRLRDLRLVAEGRKQRAEEHRLRHLALKAEEEQLVAFIKERGRGPEMGHWRGPTDAERLDLIRRRKDWEQNMAAYARWAADHPDQPWPVTPPYPQMLAKARLR